MIRSLRGITPKIAVSAYVDPSAVVVGHVVLGEHSSVWFNASVRGDNDLISIGNESNVQDNCVLHSDEGVPLKIGDRVTVGHSVVLHACTVEDDALIGIGAIVLNDAVIGKGAVVAAGALVPEGMHVPPETMVVGVPAKVRRGVTPEEKTRFEYGVRHYVERTAIFKAEAWSKDAGQ
jgi:carbonic anhydrase/acetyltransferase-like protein (isoleucine patch superfamily)